MKQLPELKIGTAYCIQMTPSYMLGLARYLLQEKKLTKAEAERYIKSAKQCEILGYERVPTGCDNYDQKTGECLGHKG